MPLHVGAARISRNNRFNRSSLCSLTNAWAQIQPLLADRPLEAGAKIVLAKWRGDPEVRQFAT